MDKKRFKLSVFTENMPGIVNRVTLIFTRRKINMESLNVTESEIKGILKFDITLKTEEEQMLKIVKQLEKQVEIFKAYFHSESDMLLQELATFKLTASVNQLQLSIKSIN